SFVRNRTPKRGHGRSSKAVGDGSVTEGVTKVLGREDGTWIRVDEEAVVVESSESIGVRTPARRPTRSRAILTCHQSVVSVSPHVSGFRQLPLPRRVRCSAGRAGCASRAILVLRGRGGIPDARPDLRGGSGEGRSDGVRWLPGG